MKVADESIACLDRGAERIAEFRRAPAMTPAMTMVYASQRSADDELEHDGRGLLIAILLCMACWAGLGFFLLT